MESNTTNILSSLNGEIATLKESEQKLLQRNQQLETMLISLCNEGIKSGKNGIRYVDERRDMSKNELFKYYGRKIRTWETRKKSLFLP